MNILVITPFYKQDRCIGSVRWTNLSQRLRKKHNVLVVSQPLDDMDLQFTKEEEDNLLIARLNQKTFYEKTAVKHFHAVTGDDLTLSNKNFDELKDVTDSFIRKLKNRLLYSSMKCKAKNYAKQIEKAVIPKDIKIDVVISSACPFIEMLFGYELKKRLGCKWISDFRDLPFTEDNCDDTHIQKKIMKKVLKSADAIITIANKGKEKLVSEKIVENPDKIHIIRNGFSLADARKTSTINDDKLHIVHTGSLYGGTRKADLFFESVLKAKSINPEFKYVLECAGGNNETLVETARKYNEENNVVNRGFVSREEALNMQSKADILFAVVINRPGSLAAKLYEYMLNKKPVLCVTCGNNAESSEETDFINELNLGIAVEESERQLSIDKLSQYLLTNWENKISNKPLEYSPEYEAINQFDHDNLVKKVELLCCQITKQ